MRQIIRSRRSIGAVIAVALSLALLLQLSLSTALSAAGAEPATQAAASACLGRANFCTDSSGYISYPIGRQPGDSSDCRWSLAVDFGDGTSGNYYFNGSSFTASHVYPSPGRIYTLHGRAFNGSSPSGKWKCPEYTLTVTVEYPAPPVEPPVAACDAYWVKPQGELAVPAPGVLANDHDPGGLPLTVKVDQISFAVKDHPYSLGAASGALRFKPNEPKSFKGGVATIVYHVTNSKGIASQPATIALYVQASRPAPEVLKGCQGATAEGEFDVAEDCPPTDYSVTWTSARTATLEATCVTPGWRYQWHQGDYRCPANLPHATANPAKLALRLPSIRSEEVSLCGQRQKLRAATGKDVISPVYRYAPYVYLAKGEQYLPGTAEQFIAHSELWVDNGIVLVNDLTECSGSNLSDIRLAKSGTVRADRLGGNGAAPYLAEQFNLPFAISAYGIFQSCEDLGAMSSNGPPDTVRKSNSKAARGGFLLKVRDKGIFGGAHGIESAPVYVVYRPHQYIAYWFFYDYNDWHWSKLSEIHEGDWEHIRVLLDSHDSATGAEYFEHNCAGKKLGWGDGMSLHSTRETEQPVVFSARGGHASYPHEARRGPACAIQEFDIADKGQVWNTASHIAEATKQPWWGYGGSWGDRVKSTLGDYGPPGPGPHRLY